MISPSLLLVVIGAFIGFALLIHMIGVVGNALDQRHLRRHKLAVEQEKTARARLQHGSCPSCGASLLETEDEAVS